MGRNVVRRTYVSTAGRLLEPGLCSQSSHLLPWGARRSRLASVDTVKSFVFFMATEGRMCLSSWETPFAPILQVIVITYILSFIEKGAHMICGFRLKIKPNLTQSFLFAIYKKAKDDVVQSKTYFHHDPCCAVQMTGWPQTVIKSAWKNIEYLYYHPQNRFEVEHPKMKL